jgi:hypothetical protein
MRAEEIGRPLRCLSPLKPILIECGHAASKSEGTYLGERYRQLARRRGKKKALVP